MKHWIGLMSLIFIAILTYSCNEATSGLEPRWVPDPYISFHMTDTVDTTYWEGQIYYSIHAPIIDYYNGERTIFIRVAENSILVDVPSTGENLYVRVYSKAGEHEIFALNDPQPNWTGNLDNLKAYYKFLNPKVTNDIRINNNQIEIHSEGDTVIVAYTALSNDTVVRDTLIYLNQN